MFGTGTRLRAERFGVRILAGLKDVSLLQNILLLNCYRGFLPGVKGAESDFDHLHPYNAEVMNECSYRLDGPGSNPGGATFSAHVQTGPGAQPASYTMGTGLFWE